MKSMPLFALLLVLAPAAVHAGDIHVPADYTTLQAALDNSVDGDRIIVADGVWSGPGNQDLDFGGRAVTLQSSGDPLVCTISVQGAGSRAFVFHSGERLDSVVRDFTITGGDVPDNGGAVKCIDSSPTFLNCRFLDNQATQDSWGGAIYCERSNPDILDCTFEDNRVHYTAGSAVHCFDASSPRILRCDLQYGDGSGIYCQAECSPLIQDCTIGRALGGFYSFDDGGGINCYNLCNPRVVNCLIFNNKTEVNGGGICCDDDCEMLLVNCLIRGNETLRPYGHGGGIFVNYSQVDVVNCTIVENRAGEEGGAIWACSNSAVQVAGSIVRGNIPDQIWEDYPQVVVASHSNIEGGYPGTGNIDSDPLFADAAKGDYHITFGSPCRDVAASTGWGFFASDFEGDPRPAFEAADMGFDEFSTHLYHVGAMVAGGPVDLKFVGTPGSTPVKLWYSAGLLEEPASTPFGDWWLGSPFFGPIGLLPIPLNGIEVLTFNLPMLPTPYTFHLQALVGSELTNADTLAVR